MQHSEIGAGKPAAHPPIIGAQARLAELDGRYRGMTAPELVRAMIEREFAGQVAAVSSFGIEAAVILSFVADVDRTMPVVFLDTDKHFAETLAYRHQLVERLGLIDVRTTTPDWRSIRFADPKGDLWRAGPDHCCHIRKVQPLEQALSGFAAWISGRKRFHGGERSNLPVFEAVDGRVKINPLADWTPAEIAAAFRERDLPLHPLALKGYSSVGCVPCTKRPAPDAAARGGRWSGTGKTECGIHRARWARP
ncbi:MAG: phosphoadenylyl-sulfate reductase [Dongiaceae bacterium]